MTVNGQGHSIYEQIFERSEMAHAVAELSAGEMDRTKAGARHVLNVPIVCQLADHPRLMNNASQFVGPAAVPFRATLFDKSRTANWLVVWCQARFRIARWLASVCGQPQPCDHEPQQLKAFDRV
jgi:hypothetical protein